VNYLRPLTKLASVEQVVLRSTDQGTFVYQKYDGVLKDNADPQLFPVNV